jgi:hypothetical protein
MIKRDATTGGRADLPELNWHERGFDSLLLLLGVA